MALLDELRANRDVILKAAEECGLTNVRVFGSVARGEETAESDVDILVDYIPESKKGWHAFGFPDAASKIIGRRVDMVFAKGVYHLMRERVFKEATPL